MDPSTRHADDPRPPAGRPGRDRAPVAARAAFAARAPRALRAAAIVLLAAAPVLAHAVGPAGGSFTQPYPSGWPKLAGMAPGCGELSGQYLDPVPSDRGDGPVQERMRYGAWAALGFPAQAVRADDPMVAVRQVSLQVGTDGTLDVRYAVDGKEVARLGVPGDEIACGPDGLAMTARDRWGGLPFRGGSYQSPGTVRSTLYRVGGHLYVKTTATTRTRVLGVVPLWSTVVIWQRFAADAGGH